MAMTDTATNAAIIEKYFEEFKGMNTGASAHGFTIIDKGYCVREFNGEMITDSRAIKAITVRGPDGNIYVHYNGTGDTWWDENKAAYGQESDLQRWTTEYFDRVVREHYEGNRTGDLYVTGHSQGGNNAQYVTLSSQYADYIKNCITLDGPGFSAEVVAMMKARYGEAFFERQRDKIYAFNGVNDYVSALGQEQVVKDGHIAYVETDSTGNPMFDFHQVDYMLNEEGGFTFGEEGDFRKFIKLINGEILELPPEQQYRAAELIMKLVENMDKTLVPFTEQDLADMKELLIPILVDALSKYPDQILPLLATFGIELDEETRKALEAILHEFNSLSEEDRIKALEALAAALVIGEDGKLTFDASKIKGFDLLVSVFPAIWETALHHPEDILKVMKELGIDKQIADFLRDNPWMIVAIGIALPFAIGLIVDLAVLIALIDAIVHIVQGIVEIAKAIKDFLTNCWEAVKSAIGAIKEFFRRRSAGAKYANSNPYIKADPDKLRSYAERVQRVNRRLMALDSDLDGLYWQVGLLDILDILTANLVAGGSPTLLLVAAYLSGAADRLERAENIACENMGG